MIKSVFVIGYHNEWWLEWADVPLENEVYLTKEEAEQRLAKINDKFKPQDSLIFNIEEIKIGSVDAPLPEFGYIHGTGYVKPAGWYDENAKEDKYGGIEKVN